MFLRRRNDASPDLTLDAEDTPYSKSYAIVVSSSTMNDADWNRVVATLLERHSTAVVLVYSNGNLNEVLTGLKKEMPRFVAFVCQPTECGRVFVAQCHRLMRSLDKDPYIDAMWSIITGIDAENALKSIDNDSVSQPFIIQRAITFPKVDFDCFDTCFTFSDSKKGAWCSKNAGFDCGSEEGDEFPRPPAVIFYEKLHEIEPDLIVTSGHGTEDEVEMPHSLGRLQVCDQGLKPTDAQCEQVAPIIECSSNPKIFLPIANCLIGHCQGPQCMVTTFLSRMGVRQMCGYTVRTWFGRAGWGTFDLWRSVPGRLSLADAYFLNQTRIIYDLKSINPRLLNFQFDVSDEDPGYETIVPQLEKQFQFDKQNIDDKVLDQIHGLSYDRDTFVFYGDPAFIAKLDEEKTEKKLTTKFLRIDSKSHRFVIEFKDAETAQNFSLPIGSVFTSRIESYNIINGFEYEPIISDNFIMLMKPKPRDPDTTTIEVDFRGTIIQ